MRFYIFTESGTIHPDVAPETVNTGDVRCDIVIQDLALICEDCRSILGVELLMDFNGKEGTDTSTKLIGDHHDVIEIAQGAKILLSNQVTFFL